MSRADGWLMALPPRGDRLAADTRWHERHNRAVTAFRRERIGATNDLTRHERAILGLADGIEQYVGSAPDHADPLSGGYLHDILSAFRGLLAYDLGRLDAGTLDTWAAGVCERWGVDADTGAWIGGA